MKKNLKKLLSLFLTMNLVLMLSFNTLAATGAFSISIGSGSGTAGNVVDIPITFSSIPVLGINTTAFAIKYDSSRFEVIGITPGEIITTSADFKQPTIKTTEGEIYFLYSDSTGMFNPLKKDGIFATIKFKIKDTTQPGTYNISRISKTTDSTVDNDLVTIDPVFNNGSITVNSTTPSDTTAPTVQTLTATDITSNSAKLNFSADEAGTAYWLVLPEASATPTKEALAGWTGAGQYGNANYTAANATQSIDVTGLSPNTAYKVFLVVKDAANNISEIKYTAFTTSKSQKQLAIETANQALELVPVVNDITFNNLTDSEGKIISAESAIKAARDFGAVDTDFIGLDKLTPAKDKIAELKGALGTFKIVSVTPDGTVFHLNGEARVTVKALNNSTQSQTATLIIGLFDTTKNRLISYSAGQQTIATNSSTELTAYFSIPAQGQYVVKAFVWDSLTGMKPLSDVRTYGVN